MLVKYFGFLSCSRSTAVRSRLSGLAVTRQSRST